MAPVLTIAFLGWLGGALINYLADVLPQHRRLVAPFCRSCNERQPWLNYLIWPRRCPACGQLRHGRTWLVELVFVAVTLWLWYAPPDTLGFVAGFILLIYFAIVTVIDIEHRLILHPVSVVGALLGLAIGIWLHGPLRTLAGGLVGFMGMYLQYILGAVFLRMFRRGSGLDEALGFGDVILSGILGLILGWPAILIGLLLTIFLAGAGSLIYLVAMVFVRKYRSDLSIPYGPYLVLSAVLVIFFSDALASLFRV